MRPQGQSPCCRHWDSMPTHGPLSLLLSDTQWTQAATLKPKQHRASLGCVTTLAAEEAGKASMSPTSGREDS